MNLLFTPVIVVTDSSNDLSRCRLRVRICQLVGSRNVATEFAFVGWLIVATSRQTAVFLNKARFLLSDESSFEKLVDLWRLHIDPYFANVDPQSPVPPDRTSRAIRLVSDSFGRAIETYGLEGEPTGKTLYHAFSQETFDAADLAPGATPHPTRTVQDGHGRQRKTFRTTNQSGSPDTVMASMTYLPTGEMATLTRSHSQGSDTYTRQVTYDSWGRLVQNVEPNTATGVGTTSLRAWRYAYNDAGDIVATSDARGCGKNAEWDGAKRLLSETYSPCLETQRDYEDGQVTNLFIYDAPEEGQDAGLSPSFFVGKLAASYDRAQRSRFRYDGRGRTIEVQRQLAVPDPDGIVIGGGGGSFETGEYAPHWYRIAFAYDEADREWGRSVGARSAEVEELYGTPASAGWLVGNDLVVTTYSARGIVKTVGSSYGNLIMGNLQDADGFVLSVTYGDDKTMATYEPDPRRRLHRASVKHQRGAPPTILQDWTFGYDAANNPVQVTDGRDAAEWPDGAKPVSRGLTYDDLDQLRRVEYGYHTASTDDKQVSPFAPEAENGDPRPLPEGPQTKRVKWQSTDFDWQGNVVKMDDDVHAFHDRSMGALTHGTSTNGPNRVVSASGERGTRKRRTMLREI